MSWLEPRRPKRKFSHVDSRAPLPQCFKRGEYFKAVMARNTARIIELVREASRSRWSVSSGEIGEVFYAPVEMGPR